MAGESCSERPSPHPPLKHMHTRMRTHAHARARAQPSCTWLPPQRNLDQAVGVLPWLGEGSGYKVSEDEYRECMATMTTLVPDQELGEAVERLMAHGLPSRGDSSVGEGGGRGEEGVGRPASPGEAGPAAEAAEAEVAGEGAEAPGPPYQHPAGGP